MPLERLDDLRAFVQVVDSKGLTAAGKVLNRSVNQVSRILARLEYQLGARLLTRSTRRIAPTGEGLRLYSHGKQILDAADAAQEAITPTGHGLHGRLRLAVRTAVLEYGFVQDILGLMGKHPDLEVQLQVTDAKVDLAAEGYDLALRVGDQPDSNYIRHILGYPTLVLAATKAYLDGAGRPKLPTDLMQHECIRYLGGAPDDHWTLVNTKGKRIVAPIQGRFECSDFRGQAQAIYAGFGIGMRTLGETRGKEHKLERVLPTWKFVPMPIVALLPTRSRRQPKIEAVLRVLEQMIQGLS